MIHNARPIASFFLYANTHRSCVCIICVATCDRQGRGIQAIEHGQDYRLVFSESTGRQLVVCPSPSASRLNDFGGDLLGPLSAPSSDSLVEEGGAPCPRLASSRSCSTNNRLGCCWEVDSRPCPRTSGCGSGVPNRVSSSPSFRSCHCFRLLYSRRGLVFLCSHGRRD